MKTAIILATAILCAPLPALSQPCPGSAPLDDLTAQAMATLPPNRQQEAKANLVTLEARAAQAN